MESSPSLVTADIPRVPVEVDALYGKLRDFEMRRGKWITECYRPVRKSVTTGTCICGAIFDSDGM